MDDKSKPGADAFVECPSCHHKVPARTIVAILGRRLCLGCAGAWSDNEDGEDD
jgi:formylmethanofuran dehydrogenase subunit E